MKNCASFKGGILGHACVKSLFTFVSDGEHNIIIIMAYPFCFFIFYKFELVHVSC